MGYPTELAFNRAGTLLYAVAAGGIAVISTASNTVIGTIPFGDSDGAIVLNHAEDTIYVAEPGAQQVEGFSTSPPYGRVLQAGIRTSNESIGVDITRDDAHLYVTSDPKIQILQTTPPYTKTDLDVPGVSRFPVSHNSFIGPDLPRAPNTVAAVPGNAQATVSFTPPAYDGGMPVTAYTATCGANSASGAASPIVVTGLANGTAVTCTVAATNFVGTGPASAASSAVTPATVPDAPTGVALTPGDSQVSVSFSPPAFDGGAPITRYDVLCGPTHNASGTDSPVVVTGLANGSAATCRVRAINAIGPSALSASASATPASVPDPPTGLNAAAAPGTVELAFIAPAFDGGAPVTAYLATCGAQQAAGTRSPIVVMGLPNGVPVSCTAVAINATGASAPSAASNIVTPIGPPSLPRNVVAVPGDGSITVSFSVPASDGGSAITGYTATCGTQSASLAATTIVVAGLANGTPAACVVTATNALGVSLGALANTVTPAANPGAPTSASAAPGDRRATVSFGAPISDGGAAITQYTATCGTQSATGSLPSIVVPGLAKGIPVACSVVATNSMGTGPAAAAGTVTPLGPPDAPVAVVAVAGNAQVMVSFTPASDGGSPVTSFIATCGTQSAPGIATTLIVASLTNGTPVTCTVTASNVFGASGPSAASAAVTPKGPPGAPRNLTAIAGDRSVSLSFAAPANDGGSAITLYTATCGTQSASQAGTSIVVAGLVNGTPVTCTVTATNAVGAGPPSASSNSVTPAGLPGAPTAVTAVAGDAQATVSFAPPASNGGVAIASYTAACGAHSASAPASPIVVTGLANGVSVSCTVTATNSMGPGPASPASNAVTPTGKPGAPQSVIAVAGDTLALVSFAPPTNDGGAPIISYEASCAGRSVGGTSSPIIVTGLANGTPVSCTVSATNAVGTGPASAPSNPVTPAPRSFTGPVATGLGDATVTLSGGGATCNFAPQGSGPLQSSFFIPVSGGAKSPPQATPGEFPFGLLDFVLLGCDPGSTVTLTVDYPAAIPSAASYWKFGPTPDNRTPHWYVLPATIGGSRAVFTITDGGLGDDDLSANGTVVDQGGPGIPATASAQAIPTLSEWALIALAMSIALSGAMFATTGSRRIRGPRHAK